MCALSGVIKRDFLVPPFARFRLFQTNVSFYPKRKRNFCFLTETVTPVPTRRACGHRDPHALRKHLGVLTSDGSMRALCVQDLGSNLEPVA